MVKRKNIMEFLIVLKKNLKKEGNKVFYPGIKVNILKCFPGSTIQFSVYDFCTEYGTNFLYRQNY